jgi:microcystin-dependent protein
MSILVKGTDFGPTEQVTSGKLDNLVDAASFTNTSEVAVNYTGSTGTCLQGGGLEVTSAGQLQIQDGEVDLVKFSTALKDSIHPVGIILETTEESTAAAFQTKIGFGTWEAYGSGKVTVGIDSGDDDFDAIGSGTNTNGTTGAKTHTLTQAEMNHNHIWATTGGTGADISIAVTTNGSRNDTFDGNGDSRELTSDGALSGTNYTDNNRALDSTSVTAHNNLQPYIVVYRYRRTA